MPIEIADYELFQVPPRWQFLKLETDNGVVGWGEPILEGYPDPVASTVDHLMEHHVLGASAKNVEDLWQAMYRGGFYRGGPILMSAIAGIDQALWDIRGKAADQPVYDLLGGPVRDEIQLYQHIPHNEEELDPDVIASAAREQVDAGFQALKTVPIARSKYVDTPADIERVERRVAAIRDAIGDQNQLALDFHGRVSKAMAKRLVTTLEKYNPMFFEEPVLPEYSDLIGNVTQHTSIPIATGERLFSKWEYRQLLADHSVDIIQPDLSHAGGITEVKKIASMAEAHDVAMAPHCPLGPIALAACVQIDATCPNAIIQEQVIDPSYANSYEEYPDVDVLNYLEDPSVFKIDGRGKIGLPEKPGLGLSINEEYVREMATVDLEWESPLWRHEDGSVTEW